MATPRFRIVSLGVAALSIVGMCSASHPDQLTQHPAGAAPAHIVPASYQLAARAGAVTGEPPRKVCDFGFVPAKPTVGTGSIIGTAWAQCDVPPDSHVMVVSLQRRDGGWQTIASSDPDRQIPPGRPRRAAYQVKTTCVPGAWRISATATGTLQGRSGTLTDYSLERIVSQQECDRGK